MLKRLRKRVPSHTTVAAYAALFLMLGGISYAAVKLDKNSVGAKQIKKNAVRASEVKDKSLSCKELSSVCSHVTTRSETVTLSSPSCGDIGSFTQCFYAARPVTASCSGDEHAVGGGYEGVSTSNGGTDRSSSAGSYNRPDPSSGVARGWAVEASGFTSFSNTGPPADAPTFTVYALCAS